MVARLLTPRSLRRRGERRRVCHRRPTTARHDGIVVFTIQLRTQAAEVAWAARVFLLLDDDGRIREDYQLTVKPVAE